jgi:hypothetical protein
MDTTPLLQAQSAGLFGMQLKAEVQGDESHLRQGFHPLSLAGLGT